MGLLSNASVFAKITLLIGIAPLAMALAYAIRPSERRLAIMRPLSLASIFAALAGILSGVIAVFVGLAATDATGEASHRALAGLAEALVPALMTFAFLAVAWIAVAFGMRRQN